MADDPRADDIERMWERTGDHFGTPAVIARALNFVVVQRGDAFHVRQRPCAWCPVKPPNPGQLCATVPASSRRRVQRVLDRMVRTGRAVKLHPGTRLMIYTHPRWKRPS